MDSMIVGILKETFQDERRVSITPAVVPSILNAGLQILFEKGAGEPAGFTDREYEEKGAKIISERKTIFSSSGILLFVRGPGANPEFRKEEFEMLRKNQVLAGFLEPFYAPQTIKELAKREVIAFAMELIPRISRAQNMDAVTSMGTIGGYKSVLLAAGALHKMFPLFMTAAGRISPANVFVIGAGVAGLQAIATAKRLGAVVSAYDVRPAVKEQIESLGAKFIELSIETVKAEQSTGYASAMSADFYRRQQELMTTVLAASNVAITTALVPAKRAPILITREMVLKMKPGAVIIDLAAEREGNCELTQPGKTIVVNGITIMGPTNLPSTVPYDASIMYSKNITNFLLYLVKNGSLQLNTEDEIIRETMVTKDGEISNARIKEILAERSG